jgi:hypothetical protein
MDYRELLTRDHVPDLCAVYYDFDKPIYILGMDADAIHMVIRDGRHPITLHANLDFNRIFNEMVKATPAFQRATTVLPPGFEGTLMDALESQVQDLRITTLYVSGETVLPPTTARVVIAPEYAFPDGVIVGLPEPEFLGMNPWSEGRDGIAFVFGNVACVRLS